ncbi:hypothetical protein [Botrimarina hoheduenensis]|uniref:Uncharacterized protein n=1 Tax=Botrimarina hoheduenensis TaxID=2528000 RepID=A0A5C5VYW6_9BACT|nr:hypothetical protein [Botrimarina hoheduenensis]TWT43235.1 hypothetical protein Pla111_21850 [Botrimarina hoheduenensis]
MSGKLQRTVATLLASLYLLIAAGGEGLHVHGGRCCGSSVSDSGVSAVPQDEASAAPGCSCCHGVTCPAETKSPGFNAATDPGTAHGDCVACSLLAQLRTARSSAPAQPVLLATLSSAPLATDHTLIGAMIEQATARGPPCRG